MFGRKGRGGLSNILFVVAGLMGCGHGDGDREDQSQNDQAVEVLLQHEDQARMDGAGNEKSASSLESWASQRELQGELAKNINRLDEVDSSRVFLTFPDPSAFQEPSAPIASVTINLKSGASLSPQQMRNISAMIAEAVDGLSISDVLLVDGHGRLLLASGLPGPDSSALQSLVEAQIRTAILESLVGVLGSPSDVTVRVTVDVEVLSRPALGSPDAVRRTGVSQTISEEHRGIVRPEGIPGVESNLPGDAASDEHAEGRPTPAASGTNTRDERWLRVQQISVTVEVNSDRIELLAETLVKRPDSAVEDVDIANVQSKTAELQQQIEQTVKRSMGYVEGRDRAVVAFKSF